MLANQKHDLLTNEDLSDDECLRCIIKRLNCSGNQPCYRYVKDHHKPTYHISACNWRQRGRLLERYMVEPYTLNSEGQIILKDNHEEIVTTARARGRLTTDSATDESNKKRKKTNQLPQRPNQAYKDTEKPKVAMMADSDQRLLDPQTFAEAMKSNELELWKQAIREEKTSLEEKHTWDIVPIPKEVKPITSKLIFKRNTGLMAKCPDTKLASSLEASNKKKVSITKKPLRQWLSLHPTASCSLLQLFITGKYTKQIARLRPAQILFRILSMTTLLVSSIRCRGSNQAPRPRVLTPSLKYIASRGSNISAIK